MPSIRNSQQVIRTVRAALCYLSWAVTSLAAEVTAQEKQTLTLERVLTSAKRNFPAIRAALAAQVEARGELRSREGAFDLQLKGKGVVQPEGYYKYQEADVMLEQPTRFWGSSVYAGYRYGDTGIPPYYQENVTNSQGEFRAGVLASLVQDGWIDARRATIKKAEIGVQLARLVTERQILMTLRDAGYAYWDWVTAGHQWMIAERFYELALKRDKALREQVAHGEVSEFEQRDNLRAVMERKARLVAVRADYMRAQNRLALFLRDDSGAMLMPARAQLPASLSAIQDKDIDDKNMAGAIARAQARRPEVRMVRLLLAQNEVDQTWSSNQGLPRVDVNLDASRDIGEGSITRRQTDLKASLVLAMPLQRRAALGQLDKAKASAIRLNRDMRLANDRIGVEVREALITVKASMEQATVSRDAAELAFSLEASERERFRLGESNMLFVNIREQQSVAAESTYVEAMRGFFRAQADFRFAVAKQ